MLFCEDPHGRPLCPLGKHDVFDRVRYSVGDFLHELVHTMDPEHNCKSFLIYTSAAKLTDRVEKDPDGPIREKTPGAKWQKPYGASRINRIARDPTKFEQRLPDGRIETLESLVPCVPESTTLC